MSTGELRRRPGGHEAAGHAQPARARAPSTSSPRRRRSRSRSAPTSPPCPPWAWWPRRWWPSCWPTRPLRKFGGDSVAELVRNRRRLRWRRPCGATPADGRPPRRAGRDDGRRARPPSAGRLATRLGRPFVDTDDAGRAADRPHGAPRSSEPTARPPSGPLEAAAAGRRCWPRPSPLGDRRRRRRGARPRPTAALLPPSGAGRLAAGLGRRSWPARVRPRDHRPLLRRRPRRRADAGLAAEREPLYRGGGRRRRRRRAVPRRRRQAQAGAGPPTSPAAGGRAPRRRCRR